MVRLNQSRVKLLRGTARHWLNIKKKKRKQCTQRPGWVLRAKRKRSYFCSLRFRNFFVEGEEKRMKLKQSRIALYGVTVYVGQGGGVKREP